MSFLESHLTGSVPPSPAVAARMRYCLLADGIANPLDTGAQSSPRNFAGPWPWAYAVHFGIIAPDEAEPHFDTFCDMEELRGLGFVGPILPKMNQVYKVTHFTVTQHWLIAALSPSAATRKRAAKQAVHLRALLLADSILSPVPWKGSSRAIGWCAQGLQLDHAATGDTDALAGSRTVLLRMQAAHGTEGGVPFLWRNPNALTDPNHVYECSPWMDSLACKALAREVASGGDAARPLLLHGLRGLAYAQREDGTFHDDYQPGQPGVFHEAPGESTETWIWPALHAAKAALDDEWPVWGETMLGRCHDRYLALNRFKPGDSGFRDQHNMSIAIACVSAWDWRD